MFFRKLGLVILLMLSSVCYGQQTWNNSDFTKMAEIIPAPPDASALVKYAGVDVNNNTGAVIKSIDLLNIGAKGLDVPVTIRYASNGIRVNEYASRVGLGWSLSAGGSISRVIYGRDDLLYQRKYPNFPIYPGERRAEFLTYLFDHDNGVEYDAQPDIYSFNFLGYTGRFVFDAEGQIAQLPVSNLKIIKNTGSFSEWMFKIIDPYGNTYFFGGETATEKVKKENGSPIQGNYYSASVWHLKKIVTVTGEIVSFDYEYFQDSYDLGIAQTLYKADPYSEVPLVVNPCDMSSCAPIFVFGSVPPPKFTPQISTVKGYLLKKIKILNRGEINFIYSAVGYPEKLLQSVTLIDYKGSVVKRHDLVYDFITPNQSYNNQFTTNVQIPFLASIKDVSVTNKIIEHKFTYYDRDAMPQRLSFAQDHWGYFNGKVNSGLVPSPGDPDLIGWFPDAIAIREVDTMYTYKGMLKTIELATGGKEEIDYEPNQTSEKEDINPYSQLNQAIVSNTTTYNYSSGANFSIYYSHENKISANCYYIGNNSPDPLHDGGTVSIINTVSNSTVFTRDVKLSSGNNVWFLSLPPGSYKIVCSAKGLDVRTDATIRYKAANAINMQYVTKYVGGVRVKRIKTYPATTSQPILLRYYYGSLDSLNYNFSNNVSKPKYYRQYTERVGGVGECCSTCVLTYKYFRHHAMYSESVNNLYVYGGGNINYKNVIKSFGGDNYENGATSHVYENYPDIAPQLIIGEKMIGTPYTNTSSYTTISGGHNSREIEQTTFKKEGNQLVPIVKTKNKYTVDDDRLYKEITGLAINTKHQTPCWYVTNSNNIQTVDLDSTFDVEKYDIISSWNYLDQKIQTFYDPNGTPSLVSTTKFYYDDVSHLNITRIENRTSKGEITSTVFKYAKDFPTTPVYQEMISRNIIGHVIQTENYKNNVLQETGTTNYKLWSNNLVLPESLQYKKGANTPEIRVVYNKYDALGNLLEQQKKDDVKEVYLWGYNNTYPVAKILNTTYDIAKNYISQGILDNPANEQILRDHLGNLRTIPGALTTTSTYKPFVGMTSQVDVNGRIIFYDYDEFNRLSVVRDNEKRIIKKICYNYTGQAEECNTFYNEIRTGSFTKNNCSGGQGSTVIYTVPASLYSASTLQAANDLAQADVNANGQAYANQYGSCLYSSSDYSGYYTSAICNSGETPEPIYVSVPAGMFTSTVSIQDANNQALAYAQEYANSYGTCSSGIQLTYQNNIGDYIYVVLTNTSTYQQYYFQMSPFGYGNLGNVPAGTYDVDMYSGTGWSYIGFSAGCYNYTYGYTASFYSVSINSFCNNFGAY